MAETVNIRVGENTPEQVAYKLTADIAAMEEKKMYASEKGETAGRKWLLDTYAECLDAVLGRRAYAANS